MHPYVMRKEIQVSTPVLTLALRRHIRDNDDLHHEGYCRAGILLTENERVNSKDGIVLERLLSRARTGDDRAMESIYEMFKARIYQLAYRHSYNPAVAEDLLQDIFIKIFTHLGDVRNTETFPAWIYKIAMNTCYSYLRGKKLRLERTIPLGEIEGKLDEAVFDTHEKEIGKPIDDAIQTLSAKLRAVFVLHDVEGFKHNEIARMLGCSVGTSKSQLFKARMKIRGLLKGKGVL
jgi:RNA polymerase sigma-70 factor (ECF subfamily)